MTTTNRNHVNRSMRTYMSTHTTNHATTTNHDQPQDLEKQNMALCDRFIGLFAVLRTRLDKLEAHTASLEGHCQSVHAR
jgi:hypothetical protein